MTNFPLSVIVITRDAAATIARCLHSVVWAQEVVVVDSGSRDATLEIAARQGARVIPHPFTGYADQKNVALSHARWEWVLSLDADEWVTPELAEEIRRVLGVSESSAAGYWVPMKTYYFGRWLCHGGFYPDWHLRLFRKSSGRFHSRSMQVHEGAAVDGPTERLTAPLGHEAYTSVSQYLEKFNRYTTLEADGRIASCQRVTGYDLAVRPAGRWIKRTLLQGGVRDGVPGLLACTMAAWYVMVVAFKMLERQGFNDPSRSLLKTLFVRHTEHS